MSKVIYFAPGLKPLLKHEEPLLKHGTHDQSDHGNWAHGGTGGNGFNHREIYDLQKNRSDSQMRKVYDAEENYQPQIQRDLPKPFPPNNRGEYATREEYDAAYKKYSKEFDTWARESSRNIKSDLGEKYLDGTRAGTQKYIDAVASSDWFREEFGNAGIIGIPKVALRDSRSAGTYQIGMKNGVGFSALVINKGYSQSEPTILHELSHFATAISNRTPYDGHGIEFVKNHIHVVNHAISPAYADGLQQSYEAGGINLGN